MKMSLLKKTAVIAVTAAIAISLSLLYVQHAQAAGQICAQSGSGYCLNNWNGANGAVKMGQNGWTHQLFGTAPLSTMCGGGRVTGNCPFSELSLDSDLLNQPIETVKDASSGLCVGLASSTSTAAVETTCPNSSGVGGGWGVVEVQDPGTCTVHLDNVRASDNGNNGDPFRLRSGGAIGAQALMADAGDGTTCWGTG